MEGLKLPLVIPEVVVPHSTILSTCKKACEECAETVWVDVFGKRKEKYLDPRLLSARRSNNTVRLTGPSADEFIRVMSENSGYWKNG